VTLRTKWINVTISALPGCYAA